MQVIIDRQNQVAVGSLFSQQPRNFNNTVFGTQIPLQVTVVDPIANPQATTNGNTNQVQLYKPVDIADWELVAGLGQTGLQPLAGTWTITFTSGVTTTTSGAIPYNVSASALQAILNAMASIVAAGGVTVLGVASGYFLVTFVTVGARADLIPDNSDLAPQTNIETGQLVEGTSLLQCVQSIRLVQNPAGYIAFTDDLPGPAVVVVELATGGTGVNAKYSITLTPASIYSGNFTLTVGGNETTFIPYNDDGTVLTTALEALASVGAGNVEVTLVSPQDWIIMFIDGKAETDMGTITGSAAALSSLPGKSGTMLLDTSAAELLLAGKASVAVILDIQGTQPAAAAPDQLLRINTKLLDTVLAPGSTIPTPLPSYLTAAQVQAIINSLHLYTPLTFSTAGTTTITKGAANEKRNIQFVTIGTGVGTYTRNIALATTDCLAGDEAIFILNFPASTNPTLSFNSATPYVIAGNGSAYVQTVAFVYDGSAWQSDQ